MKETSDADKASGSTALSRKSDQDLPVGLGPQLRSTHHIGSHPHLGGPFVLPQNLQHQLHLAAGISTASTAGILYPSLLQNPAAIMASLSRHNHIMRGRPPMPHLMPPSGNQPPAIANFHATLAAADITRQNDLFSILKDSVRHQELFSTLSKLAASSSTSSTSASLSTSSLSSSSSPSSSSSLHHSHQDSPGKAEVSPLDKRCVRSSSLSPSSYMTPRSLNGSPSTIPPTPNLGSHLLSPNTINSLAFGNESLSPAIVGSSSPLGMNNRVDSTSATPMRKASTPRPDRVFTCKICNRSFGYKHVLQNHERTHTGEKPFECKECHKRFTRDHHLKTHMRLHTGEKPYHCSHCDRQFVQVANLRRHLRVHTGEKPYSCDTCPSRFSDSNQLKAHLLIHKGEKPFACSKCMNRFRRRHHLLHHKCSELDKNQDSIDYNAEMIPYRDVLYPDGEDEVNDNDEDSRTAVLEDLPQLEKRRERKSKEPRRVIHQDQPQTSLNITPPNEDEILNSPQLPPTPLPEQTEPEDLSINSSRSRAATYRANIALTTSGYGKHPLRYSREEFMSDEEASIKTTL